MILSPIIQKIKSNLATNKGGDILLPEPKTHTMELSVLFSWSKLSGCVIPKETRERWPLLTVETEVNGDSKRTNEVGPFFVGLLSLSYRTAKT